MLPSFNFFFLSHDQKLVLSWFLISTFMGKGLIFFIFFLDWVFIFLFFWSVLSLTFFVNVWANIGFVCFITSFDNGFTKLWQKNQNTYHFLKSYNRHVIPLFFITKFNGETKKTTNVNFCNDFSHYTFFLWLT